MAEKNAKLQDIEDVEIEDLQTEDEDPVSSVYVLAGKAFSISKDSQKTIDMLSEQLREALPDTGQRVTDMGRIVDRVQTLMSTNFRDIQRPSKLKEKAKSLRTNLRRRITDLSKKILPKLEEIDPPTAEVGAKIEALNEATIELQRLLTDEAALTLILRRDMTDDEAVVDVARRKDRVEVANSLIQQARVWVNEYGPGESNPGGKLLVLGSAEVADVDEVYDTSVVKVEEVEEQQGQTPRSVVKEPSPRSVSPEPSKRPAFTSTPYQPDFQPMSPQTAPRVARKVSFGEATNLGKHSTEEGGARRYPDTPARKPTYRDHEEEYYRYQNQSQTDLPLFPEDLSGSGSGSSEYFTANDQSFKSSTHSEDDNAFTQTLKNLSNNIIVQYQQPSANEKVPKFDGDYTKWSSFWQAFSVLVDKNSKVPVISKLNKLNQAVEGEAAAVISMFEFNEESYELAKMALINEYGDPALCANKMLRDLQNLERVKANDVEGLRNLHIRSKQLVLRVQRLYPTIMAQPILITSTIENKMSPECLYKWEEENTRRKRDLSLPPPDKQLQWILNWLGDYIQTCKRSTIKMNMGDDKAKKGSNGNRNGGNGGTAPKTLNNFFTMAEQRIQQEQSDKCIFCGGNHFAGKCRKSITVNAAVEKARKAKVCLNCLRPGHFARDCQQNGCKEAGCSSKHHVKLHGGDFRLK